MNSLGLVDAAGSRAELQAALARALNSHPTRPHLALGPTAASLVANATPRKAARSIRPRRLARTALAAAALASVGASAAAQ